MTKNNNYYNKNTILLVSRFIPAFIILLLSACASAPEKESGDASEAKAEPTTETVATAETKTESSTGENKKAEESLEITPLGDKDVGETTKLGKVGEKPAEPLRIVDSCKDEPFVNLEKQAMASLQKGLEATKAEKYGVGFRNMEDYKRWKDIHEKLFKAVNQSCEALKQCASKNAKDKEAKCGTEAYVFNEWQQRAEHFTEKAKVVEKSEPAPICSFDPNLADDPDCFHGLGDSLDAFCSAPECKEVSDCWRGVGFLDQAITQARQACGFVHQELSTCRGYVEATDRRKEKFNRCKSMHDALGMPLFPAI